MFLVSISLFEFPGTYFCTKRLAILLDIAKFSPSFSFKINVIILITHTYLSINGLPEFPYFLAHSYKSFENEKWIKENRSSSF